jgi:lipopolysaccharide biosynthesis regulator YciM
LAAGLAAAFAVTVVPAVARAQRQQVPGPDTKRVLVTAFRGDVDGGVQIAEEIRGRVSSEFNIRQLMPNSKKDIENTLQQSGYRPDSALSPNDIKELAKLVRADEVIDGTVTRIANGYRTSARFFLPRDAALSQPLVATDNANLGDVAREIVREYDAARKQLQANQACENAIRDRKLDVAIAEARRGIQEYPKATLARLCLASAFQSWKATADSTKPWADSVIKITKEVTALDPRSKIAYTLAYDAYKAKGDTASALKSLLGMMAADPTNATLREQVITELVQSGKAELAIPTAKQLRDETPGDPQYARLYWLVLRAAKHYKESVPVGEEYVKLDTAAADSNYFFRQIADLAADSSYAKAAEFAARGVAKFPSNVSLMLQQASNQRRAGQLPAAQATLQRALQVNPKAPGANMILAQIANDAGNADSVVKYVKADAAADATNKDRDAQYLAIVGQQAYKAATTSKKIDDFKRAITLLAASDEISPTPAAKFFEAYSAYAAFTVAAADLPKSKSCADTRAAQDYLTVAQTKMPGGGSVSPAAAQQVLSTLPEYQTYIEKVLKAYCK